MTDSMIQRFLNGPTIGPDGKITDEGPWHGKTIEEALASKEAVESLGQHGAAFLKQLWEARRNLNATKDNQGN